MKQLIKDMHQRPMRIHGHAHKTITIISNMFVKLKMEDKVMNTLALLRMKYVSKPLAGHIEHGSLMKH